MGFFGQTKRPADVPVQGDEEAEKGGQVPSVATDKYDSDSTDTNSLEAQNEREVQQHPDTITADAHIGVQKAEASALVWGKSALIFIYAWCVSIFAACFAFGLIQNLGFGSWSSCLRFKAQFSC